MSSRTENMATSIGEDKSMTEAPLITPGPNVNGFNGAAISQAVSSAAVPPESVVPVQFVQAPKPASTDLTIGTAAQAESTTVKRAVKPAPIIYKVQFVNDNGTIIDTQKRDTPYRLFRINEGPEENAAEEKDPVLEIKHSVLVTKGKRNADEKKLGDWKINTVKTTTMTIYSPELLDVLRTVVDYYPKVTLSGETLELEEPYIFLLHNREELGRIHQQYHDELKKKGQLVSGEALGDNGEALGGSANDSDITSYYHLTILLNFLDLHYKKKMEAEARRHSPAKDKAATATFQMLWMLFKPGTRVYSLVDDYLAGFIVMSIKSNYKGSTFYKLSLWNLNYDGRHIGRCKHPIFIAPFDGEKEITNLLAYPVDMVTNKLHEKTGMTYLRIQKSLEKRGEKYFNVLRDGSMQVDHEGDCTDVSKPEPNNRVREKQFMNMFRPKRWYKGRVILDPTSGYAYSDESKPSVSCIDDNTNYILCGCAVCQPRGVEEPKTSDEWPEDHKPPKSFRWKGYDNIDPLDKKTELGPEHYFLFPQSILGFMLKSRTWAVLDITCTKPVVNNKEAIKTLVMHEKQLRLIKALSYRLGRRQGSWAADFIQSKGEGQIFLLHGPPGVGKTYTAECIAEYTDRPLLCLTCADIGINEETMEKTLMNWFNLAENWGAVMLIDEADVYLEKRVTGDLTRNSLVSAFLRSMEYYRGILFLTTNRIGKIDDAIMSRVHIVIGYKILQHEDRNRIWQQFFDKLEKDRSDIVVDARAVHYVKDEFVMKQVNWNGREIRNAFQTAVAIAEYDAKIAEPPENMITLRKTHFEQVVEISETFKTYMKDAFGSEAKRAKDEGNRQDYPKKGKGLQSAEAV